MTKLEKSNICRWLQNSIFDNRLKHYLKKVSIRSKIICLVVIDLSKLLKVAVEKPFDCNNSIRKFFALFFLCDLPIRLFFICSTHFCEQIMTIWSHSAVHHYSRSIIDFLGGFVKLIAEQICTYIFSLLAQLVNRLLLSSAKLHYSGLPSHFMFISFLFYFFSKLF